MIIDLHAHTYYSADSCDSVEALVEKAIEGGIELLGISDHNYWVGHGRYDLFFCNKNAEASYERTLVRYYDHINAVKALYAKRIKLLCGLEVSTHRGEDISTALPQNTDVSFFDFCLVENLTDPCSIAHGDIFSYAKRLGCPTGIAHTDLFGYFAQQGIDPCEYLSEMAAQGIFWELNVNRDSIHGYSEHQYVKDLLSDKRKQEIVRASGVRLSIGFDSHDCNQYDATRIREANEAVRRLKLPVVFDE